MSGNTSVAHEAKYVNVTDADFAAEVLKSDQPVLVDFWAAWCGPCRMVGPVIEELAKDYSGKVKVAKVDVDQNPQTSAEYQITSIPSLLIFKNGAIVDRAIGAVSKKVLAGKLDAQLAAK
jgi:thioredoxin 1